MSSIPQYPDGDPTSVLRLEVEDTAAPGLVNRVPNPNGDLGAWGWSTPRAGQLLEAKPWYPLGMTLQLTSAQVTDNTVSSVPFSVTPGKYVAGAWTTEFLDANGGVRGRITFRNAAGAVVSSTAWVPRTTTGRASIPSIVVPATAVDAYLTIEMGNGTFYPLTYGGYRLTFRDAVVAQADTAGGFGVSRTNLFAANPSFETAISSEWVAVGGCTIAWTSGNGVHGANALSITPTASGQSAKQMSFRWTPTLANRITVTRGQDYAFSLSALASNTAVAAKLAVTVEFADGTRAGLGTIGSDRTAANGGAVRLSRVFTVPQGDGATTAISRIYFAYGGTLTAGAGRWHAIDGLVIESGAVAGDFITGTQVTTDLANLVPVTYRNIIGPVIDLNVTGGELDVRTLSGEIVSAALDPAVDTLLRRGRRVRLRAYVGGIWESLFTGKLEDASTSYDPLNPDPEQRARISLVAYDPTTALARTPQADSVAKVSEVPYLVEDAGVPWDVDGSPNSVASAVVVGRNENATALDQVALVRDSTHGYAWVDRHGVLKVRSALPALGQELMPIGKTDNGATDAAKWSVVYGTAAAVVEGGTPDPARAPYVLRIAKDASAGPIIVASWAQYPISDRMPCAPGQTYRFQWDTKTAGGARKVLVSPVWYDAADNFLGTTNNDWGRYRLNSNVWTTHYDDHVAPAGAVAMAIAIGVLATDFDPATETAATPIPANEGHLFDNLSIKAIAGSRALTEAVYNPNVVVGYDPERIINIVTIKRQYLDATGATKEIIYGPYTDAASVSEHGPHSAEFTVVGVTSTTASAWAAQVLAKNANPARSVQSLTIPINYDDEAKAGLVTLDTYDPVAVTNPVTAAVENLRVATLGHRINAEGHLLDLGFLPQGSVASPQAPPALPSGAPAGPVSLMMTKDGVQSLTNATYETIASWTYTRSGGVAVPSGGVFVAPVSGTYIVSAAVSWAPNVTGRRIARVIKNNSGADAVAVGDLSASSASANSYVSLDTIVPLSAGDDLRLQAWQNSGAGLGINSGAGTRFNVYRLGD